MAKAIIDKAVEEKIDIEKYSIDDISGNRSTKKGNTNKSRITIGRGISYFYNGHRISVGNIQVIKEQFQIAYNKSIYRLNQTSLLLDDSYKHLLTTDNAQQQLINDSNNIGKDDFSKNILTN